MRIGLVYEDVEDIPAIAERLDGILTSLGHEVEVDYKHQEEITRVGWLVAKMQVLNRCVGFLGVRTIAGPERKGRLRGLNDELALIDAIRRPLAMTFADSWRISLTTR